VEIRGEEDGTGEVVCRAVEDGWVDFWKCSVLAYGGSWG